LSKTGVDAVKFQTHLADAESSIDEPFRIEFSYQDSSRYEYWKRMEFSLEQWVGIKRHCDDRNMLFLSSPFSNAAVDLLEKIGVEQYKVGSGEITNHLLLRKIAALRKPVLLSSGMSSWNELDAAVKIFRDNREVSILQCVTAYPSAPEQWGLNVINELRKKYGTKVGFSDHSGNIFACLAAAALGAEIFEFHVVFHKDMFGPDTKASISMIEVPKLVEGIKDITKSIQNPVDKSDVTAFADLKRIFEKSLAVNRPLKAGDIIEFDFLEGKKPRDFGIPSIEFEKVIGKKLVSPKSQWQFLQYEDLEP
jgi:N-acetylneuraminate synthase